MSRWQSRRVQCRCWGTSAMLRGPRRQQSIGQPPGKAAKGGHVCGDGELCQPEGERLVVFSLVLLTYFMVVSGIVYDVIVEPPGIGSTQDPYTGSVKPLVFMPGRVNGQYIIEGLSSGFMFVVGGVGIILMGLALDKNRAKSVKVSYATAGISSVVIAYVMSMLFIRIKIPAYLH
ncbi:hypothetical protein DKX38_009267 [Salix brachista]|uniref:Oligosaccharyltransferase complex subunit n=1 Tax=Salix brachista TaxID=2182728 RepID=A0A5N5MCY9_9ROSI|nr:hypothetical protein DKX38_009267 [Salix brachista]